MKLRQRWLELLDQLDRGQALPAVRRVFLAFALIATLMPIHDLLINAPFGQPLSLRVSVVLIIGLLAWRWGAWVWRANWRYADLGLEWLAITLVAVVANSPDSILFIVYVGFFLRPLIGTKRWSIVGAMLSVSAVFIGAHLSGQQEYFVTSPELLRQIPMFITAATAGLVLAHVVRRSEKLATDLIAAERRYRTLAEQLPQVVYTGAPDGTITYVSPQIENILGLSPDEIVGHSWEVIMPDVHPVDRERVAADVIQSLSTGTSFVADMRFQLKHRGTVWTRMTSQPVFDSDGKLDFWIGNLNDVTTQKQLENKLTYQAFHDGLTGLPNRALFYNRLEHAIARSTRQETGLAVLFLDLDNFKVVNDSLGHEVGDELVRAIGVRLTSAVRASDTVARVGGDEFVLLLERLHDEATAVSVAEQILR